MTLNWATKRKFIYTAIAVLIVVVPIGWYVMGRLYQPPTCFDGEQNQGEAGTDCGGPCSRFCAEGNERLEVLWDRSVLFESGAYNAVASVENALDGAGLKRVVYTFRLRDEAGEVIAKREGTTFVNPGENFVLFEPRIQTGYEVPVSTFLTFEEDPDWIRTTENPPKIVVLQRKISDLDTQPRLVATLRNPQLVRVQNINVTAVVYGVKGNVIGVSGTYIEAFPRTSERQVYFTWPSPFAGEVSRIDILPRVSVFDWEKPL